MRKANLYVPCARVPLWQKWANAATESSGGERIVFIEPFPDTWCGDGSWGTIKKKKSVYYIKQSLLGQQEKWESLQAWGNLERCTQQGRCSEVLMNLESSPYLSVISCTLI